jgi:subtilisin family serine protease
MTAHSLIDLAKARNALSKGRGQGVKIAVLDSGINPAHPAVAGLELKDDLAIIESGASVRVLPGEGRDLYGHGTAIAYIIRQMAPEAQIGSFRVLGDKLHSRTAIIAEGARQAIDHGYHILNCSFGCGIEDHILRYKEWVDEAFLRGIHVVSSCNNDDENKPEWPGYFPTVLTVNFCRMDNWETFYHRQGHLVEFLARGQDIELPWLSGETRRLTGSSYATGHLAGILARLVGEFPGLHPLEAKAALRLLAAPWPDGKK